MDATVFWTAFGAIGTAAGAITTAVAVWISLKPYRKKIGATFSTKTFADGAKEHAVYIANTGHSIFIKVFCVHNRINTIFSYELDNPVLIPTDTMHEFPVDDEDADALRYHVHQHPNEQVYISIQDVHGKEQKIKLDTEWLKLTFDCTENVFIDS